MPEVSQFYGIVIRLHFDDHPPPHFHAEYGDDEALIAIGTLRSSRAAYQGAHLDWWWNGHHFIKTN